MSKFSASLLAISFFIVILSGCGKQSQTKPVSNFTANAQIQTKDTEYSAVVTSSTGQNILIEVTSPDTLCGVTYQYTSSTLYIEYDGLKCTTNSDYLPSYSPFEVIIDTLLSLSYTQLNLKQTDGDVVIYTGSSDNGDFTLYVDQNTGFINAIEPSYTDCEISFTEINTQQNPPA